MNRQIALAYAIAGLSAAIATVVVVGTTVGFDAPPPVAAPSGDLLAQADDAPARVAPTPAAAPAPGAVRPSGPAAVPPPVIEEVVYVDETGTPLVGPQTVRADDDEDEDDDEHETAHEDEDEDDDDDRHGRRRAQRRDHDDD